MASGAGFQLDVVEGGTYGQVAERQGVPCADFGVLSVLEFVSYFEPGGGEYVAFFAVVVVKESDATVTVWVIFDGCNRGGHSIFVPFEVDDAVALFMAATAVAGGSSTVVVSATWNVSLREEIFQG